VDGVQACLFWAQRLLLQGSFNSANSFARATQQGGMEARHALTPQLLLLLLLLLQTFASFLQPTLRVYMRAGCA
jgi:hypothetical protein